MRKIWLKIVTFFDYFFLGVKSADDIVSHSVKGVDGGDGEGIIQQKEAQSVYADMLKGEVTQEVKEFRHNMYQAERKSYEYEYKGNGIAQKKNMMFDYDGNVENSDNRKIIAVQENKEDPSTLFDFGIYTQSEGAENVNLEKLGDPSKKGKRNFTLVIDRDFIPSMRIEEYATKIVVKSGDDDSHFVLDIYVSQYQKQFDRRSRIFLNEINRIYEGDKRSEVVDFKKIGFIAYGAYGLKDLTIQSYDIVAFTDIIKFDGSFVLRFIATAGKGNGHDIVDEFYDEKADEKNRNHERRENASISLENAIVIKAKEDYDASEAEKLINEFENEEK